MRKARPHDDTRGWIDNQKGRSDGLQHGPSAVPAMDTRKARTLGKRGNRVAQDFTRKQIESLPDDAEVYVDGNGNTKLAVYWREPEPRKQAEPEPSDWIENPIARLGS